MCFYSSVITPFSFSYQTDEHVSGAVRLNSFQKLFRSVKVCVHKVVGGVVFNCSLSEYRSQYEFWHFGPYYSLTWNTWEYRWRKLALVVCVSVCKTDGSLIILTSFQQNFTLCQWKHKRLKMQRCLTSFLRHWHLELNISRYQNELNIRYQKPHFPTMSETFAVCCMTVYLKPVDSLGVCKKCY